MLVVDLFPEGLLLIDQGNHEFLFLTLLYIELCLLAALANLGLQSFESTFDKPLPIPLIFFVIFGFGNPLSPSLNLLADGLLQRHIFEPVDKPHQQIPLLIGQRIPKHYGYLLSIHRQVLQQYLPNLINLNLLQIVK